LSRAQALVKRAVKKGVWEEIVDDRESGERPSSGVAVMAAVKAFLKDCESASGSNLLPPTVSKYRTAVERLLDFCDESGYDYMSRSTKRR
jgi:hypothetical protein